MRQACGMQAFAAQCCASSALNFSGPHASAPGSGLGKFWARLVSGDRRVKDGECVWGNVGCSSGLLPSPESSGGDLQVQLGEHASGGVSDAVCQLWNAQLLWCWPLRTGRRRLRVACMASTWLPLFMVNHVPEGTHPPPLRSRLQFFPPDFNVRVGRLAWKPFYPCRDARCWSRTCAAARPTIAQAPCE
jgi:hypothetical protein